MPEPLGQILPDSAFGRALTEETREAEVIVEVGGWHGRGSTLCIANGLIRPSQRFISIEQDPKMHEEAKGYYNDPRITFIRGHTLDPEVMALLPEKIDLLLLDGDDFATDKEWDALAARSTVVALDDTMQRKNWRQREIIETEMITVDRKWQTIAGDQKDRHGWMIARQLNDFDRTYLKGGWDGAGSGPGSTPAFTMEFRLKLEKWMRAKGNPSVLDYGCGDWWWQQFVPWGPYIGWDLSWVAIQTAKSKAGSDLQHHCRFHVGDPFVQTGRLELANLLIVKDVMHHTDYGTARRVVDMSKQFPMVLWVVDLDGNGRPCFWPDQEIPKWELFHQFDTSVENYRYGPKAAFLQRNHA